MNKRIIERAEAEQDAHEKAQLTGRMYHVLMFPCTSGFYYEVLSDKIARRDYGEDFERRFLVVLSTTY